MSPKHNYCSSCLCNYRDCSRSCWCLDKFNGYKLVSLHHITTCMISFTITEPKFTELKEKFEGVADWDRVCPFLINDDDGQKTKQIKKKQKYVADRHTEIIKDFLRQPHPTWRDVVEALRAIKYTSLADEIEHDLQG